MPRDPISDDGPELLPPPELLHLRAELATPPSAELRSQHLVATAMAARQRGNHPVGRFASRGARAAIAIVASLAITTSLAGAQLLPDQAQRLLSNVSERFAPSHSDPPADPAEPGDATTTQRSKGDDAPTDAAPLVDETTSTTDSAIDPADASTTTTRPSATGTTIPGPAGPGSPDDPIDPGGPTDPGPTDPDPTTTTTVPPTTTTTEPPTTTTTVPPTTTTTTVPLTPDDPPPSENPPPGGRR